MNEKIYSAILKRFAGAKWANPDSARHKEACALLDEFDDSEILEAVETLGASLVRTFIKPEELVGEIKRNRKRTKVVTIQQNEQIIAEQVAHDRTQMLNELIALPSQAIGDAVRYLRSIGVIGHEKLSRDLATWSPFTIGMVWASCDAKGVMR